MTGKLLGARKGCKHKLIRKIDRPTKPLFRRHLDIPIPYVLLLFIPLPVIPIPDIPTRKIEISNIFAVFMLGIPIPEMYTTFLHN